MKNCILCGLKLIDNFCSTQICNSYKDRMACRDSHFYFYDGEWRVFLENNRIDFDPINNKLGISTFNTKAGCYNFDTKYYNFALDIEDPKFLDKINKIIVFS